MTSASDTTNGWYLLRQGVRYGPYRWEQLQGYAREGTIVPEDLVWHPSLPAWAPAATVTGLGFQRGAPAPPKSAEMEDE